MSRSFNGTCEQAAKYPSCSAHCTRRSLTTSTTRKLGDKWLRFGILVRTTEFSDGDCGGTRETASAPGFAQSYHRWPHRFALPRPSWLHDQLSCLCTYVIMRGLLVHNAVQGLGNPRLITGRRDSKECTAFWRRHLIFHHPEVLMARRKISCRDTFLQFWAPNCVKEKYEDRMENLNPGTSSTIPRTY